MPKSDNEARRQRILDVAAKLFIHYGYDKTTVSDIAGAAGISKGAIYLHFDSKDALFEALLLREMATYAEKWLARIEADPQGGTIGGMYKNTLFALSSSDFMSAMFRQDSRVLGSYLHRSDSFFRGGRARATRAEFIKKMQAAGAVRQDVDPVITAHIMNMLAYGLVGMDRVMAREDIPPTADIIEGIADFMDRALTPQEGDHSEAGKAVLREMFAAGRYQLDLPSQPRDSRSDP